MANQIRLLRAQDHVHGVIVKQIALGRALFETAGQALDTSTFDRCDDEYHSWSRYNETLLETCFTGPIAEEYEPGGPAGFVVPVTLTQQKDSLRSRIRSKVRRLKSIQDRLELFEGPVPEGDTPEPTGLPNLDPELWEHVRATVSEEQWPQAASAAATFVESKIREWSGLGPDKYGKDLITTAMHPGRSSPLTLGYTEGEKEGWHLLGMGFIAALGNVDRHRVQDRDDVRRYGLGVIYAASLLLTQFRYQHPDRTQ